MGWYVRLAYRLASLPPDGIWRPKYRRVDQKTATDLGPVAHAVFLTAVEPVEEPGVWASALTEIGQALDKRCVASVRGTEVICVSSKYLDSVECVKRQLR